MTNTTSCSCSGREPRGLDHIGLEVEHRRDLEELRDRVIAHGARILSERPQEPGLREALRCEGPGGVVFEVYVGMERRPLSVDTVLRPFARKVGHVNLLSDEKPELGALHPRGAGLPGQTGWERW